MQVARGALTSAKQIALYAEVRRDVRRTCGASQKLKAAGVSWYIDRKETTATLRRQQTNETRTELGDAPNRAIPS
jgi:hypothetical protein